MLGDEYNEDIADGEALLFARNGIYQVRVYAGNRKYIYRSLHTRDLIKARKEALRVYYTIEARKEDNLPVVKRTFSKVLNEYVAFRRSQYEGATGQSTNINLKPQISKHMMRQIERVSKFWHEYCGKRAIENIDNGVLKDYVAWRKDYYTRKQRAGEKIPANAKLNPTDKTLEWETTLAKTVLKWADDKGYRGNKQLPTWRFKTEKRIVRPAFDADQYKQLYKGMRAWIGKAKNEQSRYHRLLLRDYVLFLANTGMRVGEANNLQVKDVIEFTDDLGRKNYMCKVRGKTGERFVVARTVSERYIERNLKRNKEYENKRPARFTNQSAPRKNVVEGDWFFKMYDGNQVITLIDQFKAMLADIGLQTNRYGEAFTLYSLRHFYAVRALHRGIPIFDIARNMGASVQIIQEYYGSSATSLTMATSLGN